jgi:hypothetical protein
MRTLAAYGPLLVLVVALSAIASMYVILGERPPESVEVISQVAPAFFLVFWVVVDARRRRRVPCYDFGFLVALFYVVAVPWYLVWSRGWRGLLVLGYFMVLLLMPGIIASIVWQVKYGPIR